MPSLTTKSFASVLSNVGTSADATIGKQRTGYCSVYFPTRYQFTSVLLEQYKLVYIRILLITSC